MVGASGDRLRVSDGRQPGSAGHDALFPVLGPGQPVSAAALRPSVHDPLNQRRVRRGAYCRKESRSAESASLEEAFDVLRELGEVVESGVQQLMNAREVDTEISMDKHVTESGHAAEPTRELCRQNAQLAEHVDGTRVVGGIAARAGGQMSRDVESVLRTELESSLHSPQRIGVGAQARKGPAGVAAQSLDGFIKGEQMTPDNGGVGLPGAHRPNRAASMRARCAASILASCGA